MDITSERTVSGRSLVIAGLIAVVLVTAASLALGPGLRNDVRQSQDPRTLREPIADGIHRGEPWEAIGRFDGTANCVELRYLGQILDRACDTGPTTTVTAVPQGGPTIAYGTAADDDPTHTVALDNGEQLTVPVQARDLGFPVGFWAVALPAGTRPAD